MKKLGVLAALVAAFAFPATSLALVIPGTLDQHQDNGPDGQVWNENFQLAQTFTAGLTGSLDAVTATFGDPILLTKVGGVQPAAVGDVSLGIYATSGGHPTGVALASQNFTGVTSATTLIAEFGSPTNVTSGTQYAIVIKAGASASSNWLGICNGDPYAGGQALIFDINNNPSWTTLPDWATAVDSSACINDFEFSTYVTVPTATSQPTTTPPPTATAPVAPSSGGDAAALLLAAAVLGIAAAFVTVRQIRPSRR